MDKGARAILSEFKQAGQPVPQLSGIIRPFISRSPRSVEGRLKSMQENSTQQLNLIIEDLDSLITEIENNPRLSTWVVRQVLKSIKDKAEKMAVESADKQDYPKAS